MAALNPDFRLGRSGASPKDAQSVLIPKLHIPIGQSIYGTRSYQLTLEVEPCPPSHRKALTAQRPMHADHPVRNFLQRAISWNRRPLATEALVQCADTS